MKRRYSFAGKKHTLVIDADIQISAEQYVADQLAILADYNDAPNPPMTTDERSDLIYEVASYPQKIRNLQKQIEKKRAREARQAVLGKK